MAKHMISLVEAVHALFSKSNECSVLKKYGGSNLLVTIRDNEIFDGVTTSESNGGTDNNSNGITRSDNGRIISSNHNNTVTPIAFKKIK